jgi:nucleoside-diphosphate-sugar epimerase
LIHLFLKIRDCLKFLDILQNSEIYFFLRLHKGAQILMAKYLVTGGAGFIGSNIAEELLKRQQEVRILDDFSTGRRQNIASFKNKIELIEGDIRRKEICKESMHGVDYVLHQAALPSVPRSIEDPLLSTEINITGTLNLLIAARDKGVKRFVFASSSSVYGDNPDLPNQEGKEGDPLSPYALTKKTGEKYCQIFSRIYGFPTVCLRYFNVFGPRQNPFSDYAAVIPKFINQILAGKNPVIYGDGDQSRDFIYVSDVVEANLLAAEAENVSGQIFNIAGGSRTTIKELAKNINGLLKKKIDSVFAASRSGDIRHSFADISKAKKLLFFDPSVSFSEGLAKTIKWQQEQQVTISPEKKSLA